MTAVQVPLYRGRRKADRVVIGHALIDPEDVATVDGYAWKKSTNGYAMAYRGRVAVLMHRLILDPGPGLTVDHDNRNKLDNRRANLRLATYSQQIANQPLTSANSSGYRGVCWSKRRRRWNAAVKVNGQRRDLGYYTTAEDAARAYDAAALQAWGEFAYLNRPGAS